MNKRTDDAAEHPIDWAHTSYVWKQLEEAKTVTVVIKKLILRAL